jgi:hypothetical protein
MGRVRSLIDGCAIAAILVVLVGAGQLARAQDDDDEEEAPAAPAGRVFLMNETTFDQWVFGNMGGSSSATAARIKLESLLSLHTDEIERSCGLDSLQKRKLLLAGHGDIKRFFDRVDVVRRKFEKLKNDQNQLGQFWPEIQPLQMVYNTGLFNDESLFGKMLKTTLSPEQATRREQIVRERVLYRYWAKVDLVLEILDQSIGFSTAQRQRLVKLLAAEVRPPKRLGQNDYQAVLYQLAGVPEVKVKPIFTDVQWRILSGQLQQARGMGAWLKQMGFMPDEAPQPAEKPVAGRAGRNVKAD